MMKFRRVIALAAVLAMLAAACGSDGDTIADSTTTAPADDAANDDAANDDAADDEPADDEPADDEPADDEPAADSALDQETFSVLNSATSTVPPGLEALAAGACAAENEALPLEISQVPSDDLAQRLGLLASQNALPSMYSAHGDLITAGGDLYEAGFVLDMEEALGELGILDRVANGPRAVYDAQYNGFMASLPLQYNIEGIWYNKDIFAELDLEEPQTWDELVAAAETINAAGITPITAAGNPGWTITRWIGAHQFRSIGPDAHRKVRDGEASLTDPEYVASAQAVQDLALEHFIDGISGIDYDTSANAFLTGDAAMLYMGSWFLGNVNDPEQNQIGDAVGFMPFPAVDGGPGKIDSYPANAGASNVINPNHWGPKLQAWVECIVYNWPAMAMEEFGAFSGFVTDEPLEGIPAISQDIQQRMITAPSAVLWHEALFNVPANNVAQDFAPQLVTGGISAEDYQQEVQTAWDSTEASDR